MDFKILKTQPRAKKNTFILQTNTRAHTHTTETCFIKQYLHPNISLTVHSKNAILVPHNDFIIF